MRYIVRYAFVYSFAAKPFLRAKPGIYNTK